LAGDELLKVRAIGVRKAPCREAVGHNAGNF
jgi:hypothetical protein